MKRKKDNNHSIISATVGGGLGTAVGFLYTRYLYSLPRSEARREFFAQLPATLTYLALGTAFFIEKTTTSWRKVVLDGVSATFFGLVAGELIGNAYYTRRGEAPVVQWDNTGRINVAAFPASRPAVLGFPSVVGCYSPVLRNSPIGPRR